MVAVSALVVHPRIGKTVNLSLALVRTARALIVFCTRDELGGRVLGKIVKKTLPADPRAEAMRDHPMAVLGDGAKMQKRMDHILPLLYDEKICEFTSEHSTWSGYKKLLDATKAQSLSELVGEKDTIKMLFEGFKERFFVGEKARMVNLLSASGLQKFAQTGQSLDMNLIDTGFNQEQTIRELNYLKAHLDGAAEGQSYYLINSPVVPHCKVLYILKGYRVAMTFSDTVAPATYLKSQLDWDTMDIFYDYVMTHLLSEEVRNRPDSPVMSKERAESFIDRLIKSVEDADPAQYKY
jgi:hypothetical protein